MEFPNCMPLDAFRVNKYLSLLGQRNELHFICIICFIMNYVQSINYCSIHFRNCDRPFSVVGVLLVAMLHLDVNAIISKSMRFEVSLFKVSYEKCS